MCEQNNVIKMADALQDLANEVFSAKRKSGKTLNLGPVPAEIRQDFESKGLVLQSDDVLIDDGVIGKYIKHPKKEKGATVDENRYREVAAVILSPTHIYEAFDRRYIIYVGTRDYETGKVLKVVIHPNYERKGLIFNYAKSIGVIEETKLNNGKLYRLIK